MVTSSIDPSIDPLGRESRLEPDTTDTIVLPDQSHDTLGPQYASRLEDGAVDGDGGAILVDLGGTLELSDTVVSGGFARRGGLIAAPSSSFEPVIILSNATLENGSAQQTGGCVQLQTALLLVGASVVEGCTAVLDGGGMHLSQVQVFDGAPGSPTLITDNTSTAGSGGGVYAFQTVVPLSFQISGNTPDDLVTVP